MHRLPILACLLALAPLAAAETRRPEPILQIADEARPIALGADGRYLVTNTSVVSGKIVAVEVWEVATGRKLRSVTSKIGVTKPALGAGGRLLAYANAEGEVTVLEVASGEATALHVQSTGALTFGPDGALLAVPTRRGIELWDVATQSRRGEPLSQGLKLPASGRSHLEFSAVTFSPDGSVLAAVYHASSSVVTGYWWTPGRLMRWEVATGRALPTLPGIDTSVVAVAFGSDGRTIAAGGLNKKIQLWNAATAEPLGETAPFKVGIYEIAFSRDDRTVVAIARGQVGDEQVEDLVAWDAATGETRVVRSGEGLYLVSLEAGEPRWASFGYPERTMVIGDAISGRIERTWHISVKSTPFDVAFSPSGRWLVVGSDTPALWDAAAGRLVCSLPRTAAGAIGVTPDEMLVAQSTDAARVFELGSGKQRLGDLPSKTMGVWSISSSRDDNASDKIFGFASLAISPDGRRLATTAWQDRTLKIFDLATGSEVLSVPTGESYAQSVAFSPDGRTLAVGIGSLNAWMQGPSKNVVKLLDAATGRELSTLGSHADIVVALAFSPDGRLLASAGWDQTVRLWDVATGREAQAFETRRGGFNYVAFSPDGRTLAASAAGEITLREVATGRVRLTLSGSSGTIGGFTFGPDGRTLVSTGTDGGACVWDPETGERLATLYSFAGSADWLVVTPDGLFDGSPGGWSSVLWRFSDRIDDMAPVEAFFDEYYSPGLLADVLAGRRPRAPRDIAEKDRRLPRVSLSVPGVLEGKPVAARRVRVRVDVAEALADAAHSRGSGARDVRLFRNGSLVKVWRGDALGRGHKAASLETEVTLVAGENRLVAYAFNRDNVKSEDATVVVTGDTALARKGTAYVLAVGVDRYENAGFDLEYAAADARDFGEEVRRQQEALGRFARVEVVELVDERATKAGIVDALSKLGAEPEDAVFVYFAGHGLAFGDRLYLVPHDLGYRGARERLDAAGMRRILDHSISDEELERAFERVDAGELLLVVDACDSGQALATEDPRFGPTNSRGLAQLAYEKGMYVLTGSQAYQSALEAASLGHGYLTYALVEEGLKTPAADVEPPDGRVIAREWLDYAARRVPELQRTAAGSARKIGLVEDAARAVQRPRVFYRREVEPIPFVVARPSPR